MTKHITLFLWLLSFHIIQGSLYVDQKSEKLNPGGNTHSNDEAMVSPPAKHDANNKEKLKHQADAHSQEPHRGQHQHHTEQHPTRGDDSVKDNQAILVDKMPDDERLSDMQDDTSSGDQSRPEGVHDAINQVSSPTNIKPTDAESKARSNTLESGELYLDKNLTEESDSSKYHTDSIEHATDDQRQEVKSSHSLVDDEPGDVTTQEATTAGELLLPNPVGSPPTHPSQAPSEDHKISQQSTEESDPEGTRITDRINQEEEGSPQTGAQATDGALDGTDVATDGSVDKGEVEAWATDPSSSEHSADGDEQDQLTASEGKTLPPDNDETLSSQPESTDRQPPAQDPSGPPTDEEAPLGTSLEPPKADSEKLTSGETEQPASDDDTQLPLEGEDVIEVPEKTEDNLPSFDEWKQKMLAEQAEQEKSKIQEVQSMQPISSTPNANKKGSKKVNYASATCGAKVRATNPEAQNPGFILTENKDQYIINPCKVKKWFTVELCTPVQIQSLEIGNLELFSSIPESFVVQISEGYPTKEWKPLGTFHTRDERIIQSFSVDNEQMYAHYMRVEMQSHYGAEHYCPLTVLRVFGLTVIEADEEAEEAENPEDVDEMPLEDAEKDSTLFSSATDTVISLVKTVLSSDNGDVATDDAASDTGTGDPSDTVTADTLSDAVNLQGDALNASARNVTASRTEQRATEPCAPDVIGGQVDSDSDPSRSPTEPQAPNVAVNKRLESDVSSDTTESDLAVHGASGIVTLIQRPGVPVQGYLTGCVYCFDDRHPVCYSGRQSVCGYYRLWVFMRPTCCIDTSRGSDVGGDTPGRDIGGDALGRGVRGDGQGDRGDLRTGDDGITVDVTDIRATPTQAVLTSSITEKQSIDQVMPSTNLNDKTKPATHSETPVLAEISQTPPASSVVKATATATSDTDPCQETNTNSVVDPSCQTGPDVVHIRPSEPVAESLTSSVDDQKEDPDKPPENTQTDDIQPDSEATTPEPTDSGSTNGLRDIYAQAPADLDPDQELEHIPAPLSEDIQYQKLTTGKKETTFMKLKNRIKDLELNLNLSSQYLEQLSQRYKKQMEEMYISLNRTITRLADTSRKAQEKDIKQQENIADLQLQINHLNMSMTTLKEHMSNVLQEVVERHLYLMLIEAAIFLMMLAWCLNRQEKTGRDIEHRGHMTPAARRVRVETISSTRHRRNSADDTPSRQRSNPSLISPRRSYDDCDIRQSVAERDIIQLPPTTLGLTENEMSQWAVGKKKKKKRQSAAQKSLSFGHLVGTSLANNSRDSCPSVQSTASSVSASSLSSLSSSSSSYTAHAPKKRHSLEVNSKQTNGRINVDMNGDDRVTNGFRPDHRRNGSGGPIRSQSYDHVTRQNINHRRSPSYDKNIYDSLSVNGAAAEGNCNGFTDDLQLTYKGST